MAWNKTNYNAVRSDFHSPIVILLKIVGSRKQNRKYNSREKAIKFSNKKPTKTKIKT